MRYLDAAVLYRIHAQSRPLEEACLASGVPYVLVGGVLFYQRREVKDLVAYLKLAVNPRDSVSFARAVGAPGRGIGEVGLGRITRLAADREGDLAGTCRELTAESGIRGRALSKAHELGALIADVAVQLGEGAEPCLRMICERTGYLDWLRESGDRDWEERQANVTELLEGAARFAEEFPEGGVEAWLDQVALYTNLDTREVGADRVTLMTVHNAKGLEFPHVFITGCEEGLFPHSSALDDPAELEEERRLFYVAATRAMRTLHLSASLERRRMNRLGWGGVSRFVEEIPRELLTEETRPAPAARPRFASGFGDSPGGVRRWGGSPAQTADPRSAAPAEEVRRRSGPNWKGRQVTHAIFGVGRVEAQDGEGEDARLSVVFPQVGRKKVVARYVKLLS
jgi:DNA helicase-2/ATP-dependent DNA helicase PcrA